jgi:hypothetical protein
VRPLLLVILITGNAAQFVALWAVHGAEQRAQSRLASAVDDLRKVVSAGPRIVAAEPRIVTAVPLQPTAANCPVCECPANARAENVVDNQSRRASEEAVDASNAVIDRALPTGVWTQADIQQVRRQFAQMDDETRGTIITRVLTALNNRQLRLAQPGPPL